MKVLIAVPPVVDTNTPYPAGPYLATHLRRLGHEVHLADLSLELMLRVLSAPGLCRMHDAIDRGNGHESVRFFLDHFEWIQSVIEPTIRFLQGRDPTLAYRIATRRYLPEGPQFEPLRSTPNADAIVAERFGTGTGEYPKFLASLFLNDIADAISAAVDPRFALQSYAENLSGHDVRFDALEAALEGAPSVIDDMIDELADELLERRPVDVVGLTVPFAANFYPALRIGRRLKAHAAPPAIVVGGGYSNTSLRSLSEPRLSRYVDFVTLDHGQRPFEQLLRYLGGECGRDALVRTYVLEASGIDYRDNRRIDDVHHRDCGAPDYRGLPLDSYIDYVPKLDRMTNLWSNGRWNKLVVAHGCYWRRCAFCDLGLDYIRRYQAVDADLVVDWISEVIQTTGQTGFHLVDEAAPPKVLSAVAARLVARRISITWWSNIRFDKYFTPAVAAQLAASGCVAVSGGIEAYSTRLLELVQKGVTVEQIARVTKAFSDAGILVHAYLMYGLPGQTLQETVDVLERVRQLFAAGCLSSVVWHRFAATAHSPIGQNPDRYGIRLAPDHRSLNRYVVAHTDTSGVAAPLLDQLGSGLREAADSYASGFDLDRDVRSWFPIEVPPPSVEPTFVARILAA